MALKIRLRRQGRRNSPFYRMVVTEATSRRDGKYVECLGWYNPGEAEPEKNLHIEIDRLQHWLSVGAALSEKSEALVARGAPTVLRANKEREMAKRTKLAQKRRAKS